jgi:hypothetical protein
VLANRQQLLLRTGKGAAQAGPQVAQMTGAGAAGEAPTIEGVLDALLAGKLSRDDAAARIREIAGIK